MLEIIKQQDRNLFIFLNHLPHNNISDSFFAIVSGIGKWGLIWIVIAIALFIWEEKKNKPKLVALFIAFVLSVISVEIILKNLVRRLRPELVIPFTIIVGSKSGSYSFPSGHATIAFAAAYVLGQHHRRMKWIYYLLAILIAFSRIYVGEHYPVDVIAGSLLGLLIGVISIKSADYFFNPHSILTRKGK